MSDLKELEEKLNKKQYEKSIFEIIKNTFSLGISEAQKTLGGIFDNPDSGENQITKQLEDFETELLNKRK